MRPGLAALGACAILAVNGQGPLNQRGSAAGTNEYAVRPLTGEPSVAWEARPGFRDFGAMVLSGGVVVTGNITGNGAIAAFDASAGKLLWRTPRGQMVGEPAADFSGAYAVSLADGVMRRLQAFDAKTGKVRWAVEGEKLGSFTPLLAHGGRIYLASENGKAAAYDAATGKLLWEFSYSPGRGNCPTGFSAAGENVYFGGGDENYRDSKGKYLWALDAATGRERWRFMAKPEPYSRMGECVTPPALAGGVAATTSGHVIYVLDAATGALRWSREVRRRVDGFESRRPLAEALISGGIVYSHFEEGIIGWRLADGSPVFEFPATFPSGPYLTRMALAGGVLYFTANLEAPRNEGRGSGYLYALDLARRQILWKHRTARPSRFPGESNWRTRSFLPAEGALYYETNSLLVKLQ